LKESDDFDFKEELKITCNCSKYTLYDLYHPMVQEELESYKWTTHLRYYVSGDIGLDSVDIEELKFEGGGGVSFSADISITITEYCNYDTISEKHHFLCVVEGYLGGAGVEIGSIDCRRISMERLT
jgi:hypothetical protein